jgi:PAS domain S-box-containing protein
MSFGIASFRHIISCLRTASRRLQEREARYRTMFENSPISIWEEDFSAVQQVFERLRQAGVSDLEAHFVQHPELVQECAGRVKIIDVNRAAQTLHGASSKEEVLAGLANTFTPESFQAFREELVCLWHGETEMRTEAVVKTLAGELRHVTVTFAVCPGYEATLARVYVSLVDVTERKLMEQKLRLREQEYHTLVNNLPDSITRFDARCRFLFVNRAVEKTFGIRHEDFLGKSFADIGGSDCAEKNRELEQSICSVFERGIAAKREVCWETVHGSRVFEVLHVPEQDEQGRVASVIGIAHDITERKQAEHEHQLHIDFLANLDRINRAIQKSGDLDSMMQNVLDEVRAIFDCDRVYLLYPCDPAAASWSVPMERYKPAYPGAGSLGTEIPMSAEVAAKLRLLLDTDGVLKFGPGGDHPLPPEVAARFGFQSLMATALYPKSGKPWEFGLQQCSHARLWTWQEERLLQEVGWRITDGLSSLLALRDLGESEAKYRQIIDTALEGVWLLDANGRTSFVNTRVTEIMGYEKDELLGRLAADFMFEEDVAEHRQKLKNRSMHLAESYERRMRKKNGETLWVIISASPIVTDNSDFGGSCAMLTDITARKQAELQLKQALEFTEGVINAIPDILLEVDAEGRYLNIWTHNPELLAAPKEALIGRTAHEMLPPEAAAVAMNGIREADENGVSFSNIIRLDLPQGTRWFEQSLSKKPATDPADEARFLVLSRDITERKLAEEKLRLSLEFTESVLNAIPDVLQEVDAEGRYLNIWMGNSELLTAPKELLIGRTVHEVLPPEAAVVAMKAIREADEKGFSFGNIICLELPQGTHWFEQSLSKRPATDPSGEPRFLVLSRDVTERRRMEEALRTSEQRFRALFEQSFQFTGLLTTDGKLLEANRAALEFIGVEESAVLGSSFWDTPWWQHSAALQQQVQDAIREAAGGKLVRFEATHIARDGRVCYMDFSLKSVTDSSGRVVQLIPEGRDITERKLAEEKLKASEERFRAIFQYAGVGIALLDANARIIQANPALEGLLDYDAGELEGRSFAQLLSVPDRDKLAHCLAHLEAGRQDVLGNDCRLFGKQAQEVFAHVLLSAVHGDDGHPALTVALVDDLSERRAAAAREAALQTHLAHIGRVGLMGELTATLAHELNNPLGAIANYAAGCVKHLEAGAAPDTLLSVLEKIGRQARMARDIIQQVRRFVSKTEPVQGRAEIAMALDQSLEFLEAGLERAGIRVERELSPGLPWLAMPLTQLQQIFLNLLMNAIDALQEQDAEPRWIQVRAGLDTAGRVEIAVADNGPLQEIPPQLFEAFYTTKPSGLGMGLAICHTLVEKHGGRIWAAREAAHGLAIHFTLPPATSKHEL